MAVSCGVLLRPWRSEGAGYPPLDQKSEASLDYRRPSSEKEREAWRWEEKVEVQPAKTLAAQPDRPEFDPWNPHAGEITDTCKLSSGFHIFLPSTK